MPTPSKFTFHLTSLGCAKNSVDSNSMSQLLERDGYHQVKSVVKASVLIVNTCGFINPAREESYAVLRSLAAIKKPGQLLIASGCLTQRYGAEVARLVPGVDGILGTRRWMDIVQVVQTLRNHDHPRPLYHLPESPTIGIDEKQTLRAFMFGGSAYLKIADGCRRPCAFCAIPQIKGPAVSRPLETILNEARFLRESGVHELTLIAQDTTDYGRDLGLKDGLATLLEKLAVEIPPSKSTHVKNKGDSDWIRIMYAFPGSISDRLIKIMATHPQILPYLDMPLQHAHPATLARMRRPTDMDWVRRTIATMRLILPGLAIRTAFIVGYPGETEEEFQTLLDFVKEIRFDHVGTFQFSFEPGTASEALGDPVPFELKVERYQRLMELQQGISLQINQTFVGKTLDVLLEGYNQGLTVGRSYRDAPEIDGAVLIESKLPIGKIIPVKVTGAFAYDLTGVPVQD
jgi:ribosomal protein S12 methylthiotransferase